MIVVDSNVVAYCWVNGPLTLLAQAVRVKNSEWHVPILWRSEMRSILTGYLRDGSLTASQIARIMEAAEDALAGSEHLVPECAGVRGRRQIAPLGLRLRVRLARVRARRAARDGGSSCAQEHFLNTR